MKGYKEWTGKEFQPQFEQAFAERRTQAVIFYPD